MGPGPASRGDSARSGSHGPTRGRGDGIGERWTGTSRQRPCGAGLNLGKELRGCIRTPSLFFAGRSPFHFPGSASCPPIPPGGRKLPFHSFPTRNSPHRRVNAGVAWKQRRYPQPGGSPGTLSAAAGGSPAPRDAPCSPCRPLLPLLRPL
ncbi:uncharacterized protein LOC121110892 isoform X1 [Gallus gallus]|uniref:uncharacterized protein LOC121110892 isoform X1 n=1 Tax=Gallus gallus TaxID=9031 RepID=UPI001F015C8D|nr:uncharacterized protein LOC121110892 isoform X1 [Gallus gallus]